MNTDLPDSFLALTFRFKSLVLKAIREQGIEVVPMEIQSLHLINRTEHCTAAVMSEQMDRDKGQLARLIKEMISKGLIEKTKNPNDTRSHLLSLTNNGKAVLERVLAIEAKIIQKMRLGLTPEQIKAFNKVAAIMSANLSASHS
ncbi:MarR family winged helix-turn-helix transcriptional regulator [Pseudoalteromonas sp. S16_S37]|uniref:MarR family winged helix-turn-helix transcriptional regulator n=1 Tax=Pseudoalteromonas sp. S16_S37 TaxID=2720228 RepID=UPI0016812CD2|nr:MarR family transcriptional regulator [Pseudoalteromonas sp. S16_S37]MBD1583864.1 MarR family transcriptional regulator [Pseudoalteromonas sp. S16_S37]